jgi:polysaccharide export outer membrane protein
MFRHLVPGLILLVLAACSPGGDLAPIPEAPVSAYHLGVDDQVRVITFGEEQLTGTFRVNDSGLIAIPLLGAVKAQGLTSAQLAEEIASELKRKQLLRDPSVAVEISQYRPIFILGEVKNPGQYPYAPGMTMLTAVSVAGGFTYRGVKDYGSVIRLENGRPQEGIISRQGIVQPGDVITIYERTF